MSSLAESNADANAGGSPATPRQLTAAEFYAAQRSPEFAALRRRFRGFVFPMTAAFLLWYFLYVILAVYATDFMSTKVFGEINIAIIFGVLQIATTFLITFLYIRFADRKIDPAAATVRVALENGEYR